MLAAVVSHPSVFPPVLYSARLNIAPAHFFNYLSLTKLNANWCIPLIGWLQPGGGGTEGRVGGLVRRGQGGSRCWVDCVVLTS